MRISIGIATWNRATMIERTLARLRQMAIPATVSWELLVVDNNSKDGTKGVVEGFKSVLPLRLLFEPQQGKSWALNRAVDAASGEYIIWIDDDILVEPGFLSEYAAAFAEFPNASVFGGRIAPLIESAAPPWLGDAMDVVGGVFGRCEPPVGAIDPSGPFLPFGGNMAVRTELQRACRYDVRLGRRGRSLLAGEETKVVREMLRRGAQGRWVPTAIGHHVVPAQYLTVSHIRRHFYGRGASLVREEPGEAPRNQHRPSLWVWRQALQCEAQYWIGRLGGGTPRSWLTSLRNASTAWGMLFR